MAKDLYVTCCNISGLKEQDLGPDEYVELTPSEAAPLLASSSIKRVVQPVAGAKKAPPTSSYEGDLPGSFPHVDKLAEASKRTGGKLPDIHTYEDLKKLSDEQLLQIHQIGDKGVKEIRQAYEAEKTVEPDYGDSAELDDLPVE